MRPECKELIESWHRINAAVFQRKPLSMEAAIQEHVGLFPEADRQEAEARGREVITNCEMDRQELESRLIAAEKTLSKPIDSVGSMVTASPIRVRRVAA